MVIKHVSFNHRWFYHYRFHTEKIEELCTGTFGNLKTYLHSVCDNCPNQYFVEGQRSSSLRFKLNLPAKELIGHEVSSLANLGLKNDAFKTAHSNVEVFMLQCDDKTLAVEVPLWLEPTELNEYSTLLSAAQPLTGHIDILRIEDGKIWIWDFKPNAEKEIYAKTQLFFYALMLSRRTNIPLTFFRCGYFDENYAFVFEPKMVCEDEI